MIDWWWCAAWSRQTLVEELLQERQSEGAQGEAAELIEKILKIL